MLVIANDPLRSGLVELGHRASLDVQVCTSRTDALELLERSGDRLACAVIASSPPWGLELRRHLARDYPEIDRIMVVV